MEKLKKIIDSGNREEALNYVMNRLSNKEINVIDLYEKEILPVLRNLECLLDDKNICIWKEHVKSSIIRTIVENAYPYVVKSIKNKKNKTAVILCPKEETYDIEARIFADYLYILGFDAIFVGADTPYEDFYNVVSVLSPELVLICINNYYNIISANKMIDDMRDNLDKEPVVIVSGNAFINKPEIYKTIQADYLVNNYSELERVVDNI